MTPTCVRAAVLSTAAYRMSQATSPPASSSGAATPDELNTCIAGKTLTEIQAQHSASFHNLCPRSKRER